MKLHTAMLLDRHTVGGLTIRAQTDNGAIVDVRVSDSDAHEAGELYGGGLVSYRRSGRRWVFVSQGPRFGGRPHIL